MAEAIPDAGVRARALVAVFDALPDRDGNHKLALLDRAMIHANAAPALGDRVLPVSEVAERWYELGEKEKAKTLLSDALHIAEHGSRQGDTGAADPGRAVGTRRPAIGVLAIANEFASASRDPCQHRLPPGGRQTRRGGTRFESDVPADGMGPAPAADRLEDGGGRSARARRLTDRVAARHGPPAPVSFSGAGPEATRPGGSERGVSNCHARLRPVDEGRRVFEHARAGVAVLLPLVEQIDPALVPEYFWRILATRRPAGNPRSTEDIYSAELVNLLAWYDRDVAAALFEPLRIRWNGRTTKSLLTTLGALWNGHSSTPRAAVARLEQVPFSLNPGGNGSREHVAELLGLAHEERWRKIWSESTEMGVIRTRHQISCDNGVDDSEESLAWEILSTQVQVALE